MTTKTAFLVEIDGKPHPIDDCSWLMFAPCGCMSGICMMHEDTMSEEQAWVSFEPNAEQRRRDQKAGFGVVAGLRTAVKDLGDKCPHTPTWGVAKTPIPDGYQWARQYSSVPGRRKHLVPDIGVENYREKRWGAEKTAPLCGSKPEFHWSTEWYALDCAPECLRCVAKANASPVQEGQTA
jgi:hypothetical protein